MVHRDAAKATLWDANLVAAGSEDQRPTLPLGSPLTVGPERDPGSWYAVLSPGEAAHTAGWEFVPLKEAFR